MTEQLYRCLALAAAADLAVATIAVMAILSR